MGPLYERVGGRRIRAGVLVVSEGSVAPRPFWELLQRFAARAQWLRGTFSLLTRPRCYGVVRADGASPIAGFCGVWRTAPRLTLLLAGRSLVESAIAAEMTAILGANATSHDDPFPRWRPGDPWTPLFWEDGMTQTDALS